MGQSGFIIRWVITLLGGYLVSHGYFDAGQAQNLTDYVMQASGPIMLIGSLLWGVYAHHAPNVIASVNANPNVVGSAGNLQLLSK